MLTREQEEFLQQLHAELFDSDFERWCCEMESEYGAIDYPEF